MVCGPKTPSEWVGKIVDQQTRGGGFHILTLELPFSFPTPQPGSFLMVSTGSDPSILLRRPMAFFNVERKRKKMLVKVLYRIVGRGTQHLSELSRGTMISLLGPIGNHFSLPQKGEQIALVAGGIGIAPFFLWGKQLSRSQRKNVKTYFGFRTKDSLAILKDFKKVGLSPKVAIEGQGGDFCGTVVDFLKCEIQKNLFDRILTCGPLLMMEQVVEISKSKGIPCEVSLEAKMACGMGVCLSCVCSFPHNHDERYKEQVLVCKDGPVFEISG